MKLTQPSSIRTTTTTTTITTSIRMPLKALMLLVAAFYSIPPAASLAFTSVHMPALVQRGANFWLHCQFQLAADEQLYSVKWYRNNEEFYRVEAEQQQQQQRQRFFPLAGVSVLMGNSNATHVRLANATIQTDGLYACEVSTQNLSTIRQEAEIKVFVLPPSANKITVRGLKNAYSPGDSLELDCSSDFTRPAASLVWLLNGKQIRASDRMFSLERKQLHANNLTRTNLALKFKLTRELLRALTSQQSGGAKGSSSSASSGRPKASSRPLELLRLQCQMRLSEVSDFAFNELVIGQRVATTTNGGNDAEHSADLAADRTGAWQVVATRRVNSNRILQLPSPAQPLDRWAWPTNESCSRFDGQVQVDDPMILVAINSSSQQSDDDNNDDELEQANNADNQQDDQLHSAPTSRRSAGGRQLVELPIGAKLELNCSTVRALARQPEEVDDGRKWESAAGDNYQRRRDQCDGADYWPARGEQQRRRRVATGGRHHELEADESMEQQQRDESTSMRRPNSGLSRRAGAGRRPMKAAAAAAPRGQLVAYLWLTGAELENSDDDAQDEPMMRPPIERSRAGGVQLPPPLLEWFINNLEAPEANVRYSPDLPLLQATESQLSFDRLLLETPTDGATVAASEQSAREMALASTSTSRVSDIDYSEYFNNFAAPRPIEQHLKLSLTLEKKHFETADSKLHLKCSSTQAKLLATDSITINFIAVPPNTNISQPNALNSDPLKSRSTIRSQISANNKNVNQQHYYYVNKKAAGQNNRQNPSQLAANGRREAKSGAVQRSRLSLPLILAAAAAVALLL